MCVCVETQRRTLPGPDHRHGHYRKWAGAWILCMRRHASRIREGAQGGADVHMRRAQMCAACVCSSDQQQAWCERAVRTGPPWPDHIRTSDHAASGDRHTSNGAASINLHAQQSTAPNPPRADQTNSPPALPLALTERGGGLCRGPALGIARSHSLSL